jgi:hypothetical protein
MTSWGINRLRACVTSAAYLSSGRVGSAVVYPIVVPAVCFVICRFIMPETRHISIWEPEKQAARSWLGADPFRGLGRFSLVSVPRSLGAGTKKALGVFGAGSMKSTAFGSRRLAPFVLSPGRCATAGWLCWSRST